MYKIIRNYLSAEANARLLEFAIANSPYYVPTTTSSGNDDYRKSKVLYDLKEWQVSFERGLRSSLPFVFEEIAVKPFNPSQIEMQLTAHGDGDYYKWHNDNGSTEAAARKISYVYYMFQEPKRFLGGELELEFGDDIELIEPENNMIIFFPSELQHQVAPVMANPDDFAGSRFSMNGWVRSR